MPKNELDDRAFIAAMFSDELTMEEKMKLVEGNENRLKAVLKRTREMLKSNGYSTDGNYVIDAEGRKVLFFKEGHPILRKKK